MKNKEFSEKNKTKKPNAKGVYHQYICLTRLSGRKSMPINIKKRLKDGIKLTGDIKYIVKVRFCNMVLVYNSLTTPV